MKIGVISDIHSNLTALKAVLDDMPEVESMICCGDVVGYGPRPAECLDLVRQNCDLVVKGNHDRAVSDIQNSRMNIMANEGLKHSISELSEDQKQWLESLNQSEQYKGYAVVHSHPTQIDRYMYPDDFDDLVDYVNGVNEEGRQYKGMFLGHTHVQAKKTFGSKIISNPGSVGQPRDRDPRAAYGVLDTDVGEIELHRVEYDINQIQRRVSEENLPSAIGDRLESGR